MRLVLARLGTEDAAQALRFPGVSEACRNLDGYGGVGQIDRKVRDLGNDQRANFPAEPGMNVVALAPVAPVRMSQLPGETDFFDNIDDSTSASRWRSSN